jgi:GTP-binding protein HflX
MTGTRIDTNGTAVVATRADPGGDPDPTEIRALAAAAGFEVVGAVTQTRPEDPGTNLGSGKVAELADLADRHDADAAVIDDGLTPAQTRELTERLPPSTRVIDRYWLILAIFADQAGDRRAKLQVELARLEYELPRIEELSDEQGMNKSTEKGTLYHHAEDRITELRRTLEEMTDEAARHRERRREQGFDLVALAGYTNAGKSTLLHRLADDLSLSTAEPDHPDETTTAAVEDRLFETLETTTRRATVEGRKVMLTDTVGVVDGLPHDLVESFSATLSETAAADAVVLVVDASDPLEELRSKLETSLSVLVDAGGDPGDVVVALNKVDLVAESALAERRDAVPGTVDSVVATSATGNEGCDRLRAAVLEALPTEYAERTVPNCEAAMGLVSWAYDSGQVLAVEYGEQVRIEFAGRPEVVDRFHSRAAAIDGARVPTPGDETG